MSLGLKIGLGDFLSKYCVVHIQGTLRLYPRFCTLILLATQVCFAPHCALCRFARFCRSQSPEKIIWEDLNFAPTSLHNHDVIQINYWFLSKMKMHVSRKLSSKDQRTHLVSTFRVTIL